MELGQLYSENIDDNDGAGAESRNTPQEIVENILFRLPIKSLSRFKSVSQTWNSSISNLKFPTQSVFSIFESEERQFFHSITDKGTSTEKFPVPWGDTLLDVYVSNSCNGMLLICVGTCFYLFNPATHYFVKVLTLNYLDDGYSRKALFGGNDQYHMIIGLYYDETIYDYKAVVLIRYGIFKVDRQPDSVLLEASLKGKRWNYVDHTFKTNDDIKGGPIVNGRIHWLHNHKIIRFDPVYTVFEELPSFQPPPNHTKDCLIVGIGILEGCICVSRFLMDISIDILVMKEYGVSESWTPIPIRTSCDTEFNLFCKTIYPLLMTRAGEILLSKRNEMWMYNLGRKSFKKYPMADDEEKSTCTVSYVENMDTTMTGYYWNQTEHGNLGNTEDFGRMENFWKQIAFNKSQLWNY